MRCPAFCDLLLAVSLLLLPLIPAAHAASAENRVALVIGQSAYRAVPALPNAANDAKRMAELLGNAGFDVTTAPDQSQNDMRQTISDFAGKVATSGPNTVALVFYAGHGLQIDGENYLVPVDVDPKREADIPLEAIRLNDLLNTLAALPTRTRIIMLDACRNNPFPALSESGHGLAIVDTKAGASGSFISYSTSPGAEAEDGSGEDSPYTTAVLSVARQPNLPIEEAFKKIRVAVNQATDGRQVPWESSSLTNEFKFFSSDTDKPAGGGEPGAAKPKSAATTRSVEDWRKQLKGKEPKEAHELVVADDSVPAYEAFVELFAQTPFTPRMRSLLERRREMITWQTAVAANTAASFQLFLASYATSDLAATARKLEQRVLNRSISAPAVVALGPTCPCTAPSIAPTLKKRVDAPAPTKRVVASSPKRKPPPDEVVVERKPPPDQGVPPGAVMEGIGIGVGIGLGMGGGMGGRGGGEGMSHGNYGR
jgi:uncharacterized caspase-like protein